MHLKEIGEFGFIRRISRDCVVRPDGVVRPIGDDAAAFRLEPGAVCLVTTDLLIEGVHFLREATSGFNLGRKAMAVNLSDIAAMGGTAREAFVSIAIPADCEVEFLDDVYRGMKSLAREFEVNLLGGDTTGSRADLAINVAILGVVPESEILTRNAARSGDLLAVTGALGDSRAGLHLVLKRIPADTPDLVALREAHLLPRPHLREGRFLAASGAVRAAIDVSDGLSSDLQHIVEESRVGARVFADRIPVSPALSAFCVRFGFDPVSFALAGGEDYVLLFTVAPDRAEILARDFQAAFGAPFRVIGEITDSGAMELVRPGGRTTTFQATGWDHFQP